MSITESPINWSCSCDIELAYTGIELDTVVKQLHALLTQGYSIEDKSASGWGCVISRDEEWVGDRRKLSELINQFLVDNNKIFKALNSQKKSPEPVLRIGIYYDSYTFTIPLSSDCFKGLVELNFSCEISMYPAH